MTAVVLIDPKYTHNVAGAYRACVAFDVPRFYWTGSRFSRELEKEGRWPREMRLRSYLARTSLKHVADRPLVQGGVPVGVEYRDNAERLTEFVHPEDAVYIFGPEDGSLSGRVLSQCHRFVVVPTPMSLNLAACVNVVLYDRMVKGLG